MSLFDGRIHVTVKDGKVHTPGLQWANGRSDVPIIAERGINSRFQLATIPDGRVVVVRCPGGSVWAARGAQRYQPARLLVLVLLPSKERGRRGEYLAHEVIEFAARTPKAGEKATS